MTMLYLPATDTWTVDDLTSLPPELRYEIHHGKLVIMSPARVWHEEVAARIRAYLRRCGRFAVLNVGVKHTKDDTRVPDVAVFIDEPNPDEAWHEPALIELVVEVWSRSSDDKDHNEIQWYADRGIGEYWLAKPIEGDRWGAFITRFVLARAASGEATYIRVDTTTLAALEGD